MRLTFIALVTAAATFVGAPAMSDERPVVLLELFTSQGCSSCPPADALVKELAGREDVLPLALHVDYWDYIGWADSFARPQYTERQKAYARMAGAGSIYTPQMVVGGTDHIVGYKPMQVAELLQAHGAQLEPVEVNAETVEGRLRLTCEPREGVEMTGQVNVDLVGFIPEATVEILHGENAGETITYTNIVSSWTRLGSWDGQGAFELSAPLPGDGPYALIVQEDGPGRVLATFRLR